MTAYISAREIREKVSLADLLSRLGYQPVKKYGPELLYKSMLRDNDTHPSLSVNDHMGVWFDHGTGKGGNIIDFGLAYWQGLDLRQVLDKIQQVCAVGPEVIAAAKSAGPGRAIKNPHYVVEQVRDIFNSSALAYYLQSRGVWEAGRDLLKEVHYSIEDQKGQRKHYFAAGWTNETGGWEVRNKYFKGCLGHKAISFIPGHEKNLAVFEGYFNYLSWLEEHPAAGESILVLNSAVLLARGIERAKAFSSIELYLDNDAAGKSATKEFIRALPYARDKSHLYEAYNDYNEKIQAPEPKTGLKR
jgi:hypothetical protein